MAFFRHILSAPLTASLTWALTSVGLAIIGGQLAPVEAQQIELLVPRELQLEDPLVAAERALLEQGDALAALDLLEARLGEHPDDYEALWRAAQAGLIAGVLADDPEAEEFLFERARTHGEHAVALRPRGVDGLYWAAAATGRTALQHGPRTSTRMVQRVWDLATQLLAVDPEHPGAHNILGKLNQEVMSLSAFERVIGRLLFRIDPLREATWQRALDHHHRAVAADPDVVLFRMDLGVTYAALECWGAAREQLQAALALPREWPVDAYFQRGIAEELARLPASEYSSPESAESEMNPPASEGAEPPCAGFGAAVPSDSPGSHSPGSHSQGSHSPASLDRAAPAVPEPRPSRGPSASEGD